MKTKKEQSSLKAENFSPGSSSERTLHDISGIFDFFCKNSPDSLLSSNDNTPIFEATIAIQRKNQDPLSGLKTFAKTIEEKDGKLLSWQTLRQIRNHPSALQGIYKFKVELTKDFQLIYCFKTSMLFSVRPSIFRA